MTYREETIGDCRLLLGDCRDILPTLDLPIITDPPYGIGFRYGVHDDAGGAAYSELMAALTGPRAILQYPEEMMRYLVPLWGAPDDVFAWCYNSNLPRQMRLWGFWDCAPVWSRVVQPPKNDVAKVADRPVASYDWCADINLVKGNGAEKTPHPCQIPVTLVERVCRLTGFASFVDPFLGSGTSGVAAANLGLSFVGVEKDPEYFDIACHRIDEAYRQPRLFAEPEPKPVQTDIFAANDEQTEDAA